ncbi:MAG: hypothetical protein ACI9QD_000447 [Thermoproteota archaeon]|jgi:hypothetical protein
MHKRNFHYLALTLILVLLQACTDFVKKLDSEDFTQTIAQVNNSSHFSILFSHNINGETHPCGCRHFPLGGLSQVAGAMFKVKKDQAILYVDTGDTFFPNAVLPKSLHESLNFVAQELVESLDLLGLKYFTPGDQDFGGGIQFLEKISHEAKFTFLVSNFKDSVKVKHKKWDKVSLIKGKTLYLVGVVDKEIIHSNHQKYFKNAELGLKQALAEIKKDISGDYEIVLMSHSGMDQDKLWAKKFPEINWIIGAHTQNFLRFTVDEGKTRIGQTLSRNHYLGRIQIPYSLNEKEKYSILEVRDGLEKQIKNNVFIKRLKDHKIALKKIQLKEQEAMSAQFAGSDKIKTALSCLECHTKQVDFWQGTAHSLAYSTLKKENEENNSTCIKCHTLHFQKSDGFTSAKDIIIFDKERVKGDLHKHSKKYLSKYAKIFSKTKSVRDMKESKRKKISHALAKLDDKFQVTHNFANVQCLNCHDKAMDHPYEFEDPKKLSAKEKGKNFQNKCLSCHTRDQSPNWYKKDKKGLADKLNEQVYRNKLKKVSCPKL